MIETMTIVGICMLFIAGFAFWFWIEIESAKSSWSVVEAHNRMDMWQCLRQSQVKNSR